MKPLDRPGALDVAVVILSRGVVAALTVCFLLGWWGQAVWGWLRGDGDE